MVRWSLLLVIGLAGGCGGGSGEFVPVTGTVTNADGSPVKFESGMLLFQPTGDGKAASGGVEKDGSFKMMTHKPGDGVKPGQYKVVLQLWENYREHKLAAPEKYGDATTTPLEATVDAEHTEFDFKVEK